MPSTTIHFPQEILDDIDRAANNNKISRNKFVIEACRRILAEKQGSWPEGFFSTPGPDGGELLETSVKEMEQAIFSSRRNRGATLL